MNEEWRLVSGYQGSYLVSSVGRVKSVDRYVTHPIKGRQFVKGKILRGSLGSKGHLYVHLSNNGIPKAEAVHIGW